MFIKVVLPEPEAPISATISPRRMESETPRSAGTSTWPRKYVFSMFSSRMSSTSVLPVLKHLAMFFPDGLARSARSAEFVLYPGGGGGLFCLPGNFGKNGLVVAPASAA